MTCVLDSSALLALLLGEPGGERVVPELADAFMSSVTLAEVVGHYARLGAESADIHSALDPLPFQRVPFDDELAFAAGLLLPATRSAGLSLGDRACLALAGRIGAPALTTDRQWAAVADDVGVLIKLLR